MERTEQRIERVVTRSYWRAADARVVVDAWRRSGETQVVFAARYHIDPNRIGRWAARLAKFPTSRAGGGGRSRQAEAKASVQFHRARVVSTGPIAVETLLEGSHAYSPPAIEVILQDGRSIRVPRGFAPEDLHQLLVVLAAAARG